ncbi:hypothetical protein FBY33_3098 [Arthrobacter sp. SLBN-112]|jgi:hypothetical protein|uniref:hypothetical protein n=1 Tax=Arthrobacter sp. SLBN-112 TaxID=2768452 RepID=UPI001153A7EC|nr:hypothetical protein [Arthrobacter sp. SLBN-112]TQJ41001.1 hypothetical protein FBY33_3098 [Arthrobacter sp. SLBN-112]
MTTSVSMGLVLLFVGSLSIWKRERMAHWAAAYFRRFGELGESTATVIRPALYLIGGVVFVVIGAVTILFSLLTANT